jgi:hypothetical protein
LMGKKRYGRGREGRCTASEYRVLQNKGCRFRSNTLQSS